MALIALFERQSAELRETLTDLATFHRQVAEVVRQLEEAFAADKKVYVAGNGGSAAQAQHLAEEFTVRYRSERRAYPVCALTADGAALTCIGNDLGFERVFQRQIEALGQEGDVFIGLSTSGNSENILRAAQQARARGMTVVAITGPRGKLKDMADYAIVAATESTARMQEVHLHAIHLLCEAFEPGSEIE
ncbi:MAG: SIS domain-containing protein [Candidatus Andersenbacteria bacterium]|nr:SIS domain-containing protein [Candidatus Andersenbacteria bacterium]